jgi:signal transduction histidine kinase
MVLSLVFSTILYRISTNELDRGLRHPPPSVRVVGLDGPITYEQYRQAQLDESRVRLKIRLVLFNLGTLAIGGGLSYMLARRTLEPIEEAMEAQGRFISDASHELRTPLTAMQTQVEVGLRNPKLKLPEAKELLKSTLEEVGKLRDLSNGLLRLTRSNGKDMPKQPVDLAKVASESINQLETAAKVKDISIDNKVEKVVVLGDHQSLKELVVILLDNALKYSNENTAITLSAAQTPKQAILQVTDQGRGIKALDLEHIFERFYRADTSRSKERVEGYGLGLSIAMKIVEAHQGSIEASSKLGEGSTFTVKFPLAS